MQRMVRGSGSKKCVDVFKAKQRLITDKADNLHVALFSNGVKVQDDGFQFGACRKRGLVPEMLKIAERAAQLQDRIVSKGS